MAFVLLLSVALLISLMLLLKARDPVTIEFRTLIGCLGLLLDFFLLYGPVWRLIIDSNEVTVSSILYKRTLRRDDIACVAVVSNTGLGPSLLLRIVPKEGSARRPISIPYKWLSHEDSEGVLDAINGTPR
jgi:hypothetical protein